MDIGSLWAMQFMMFFLVGVGCILSKKNILPKESKGVITDLVLDFILPCSIINSFNTEFEADILTKFAVVLGISVAIQAIAYLVSRILYNKRPDAVKRVLQYCTIVSNSGFLGLPVAESVFGAEGLMYTSVFIIPMRIMMWTAGISCFTEAPDMKSVIKKLLKHPCIVALYIGIPLMIFGAPLNHLYEAAVANSPAVAGSLITMLVTAVSKMLKAAGGCTTTLTMILIGTMLSEIKFSDLFTKDALFLCIVRQFLLPLAAFILCTVLGVDPLLRGVAVLSTGMPAGSTSAILAAKYGCDYAFATRCVVVSTLLSLVTIPIWCMFF